jgi:hypothetical protein
MNSEYSDNPSPEEAAARDRLQVQLSTVTQQFFDLVERLAGERVEMIFTAARSKPASDGQYWHQTYQISDVPTFTRGVVGLMQLAADAQVHGPKVLVNPPATEYQ